MKILIPKLFASVLQPDSYLPRAIWPNIDQNMERVCEERK